MNLSDYLNEMEYAISQVINSLWRDWEEAEELQGEIKNLQRIVASNYQRAQFVQQNSDDPEDFMLGVGMHWDTYFGEDKDQHYKSIDLDTLQARLTTKQFSYSSLAGTLLQYAKQGLSAAYGNPVNWPAGRKIGTQDLKTVILESRNQAEHWEEGSPKPKVEQCFNLLAAEVSQKFVDYKTRNLAFAIVDILGWRSYADFTKDLLSM